MVTPKKPRGKALAPTLDQLMEAYQDAALGREDHTPPGAYTMTELMEAARESQKVYGYGVRRWVMEQVDNGLMKRFNLMKFDMSGKLRRRAYYQPVSPKG